MGIGEVEGEGGVRMWRRGRVCMENINGVSGSGVSFKTSTFLLVLMRTVLEQAAWRHCCKNQEKERSGELHQWQNFTHTHSLPGVVFAGKQLVMATTTGEEM